MVSRAAPRHHLPANPVGETLLRVLRMRPHIPVISSLSPCVPFGVTLDTLEERSGPRGMWWVCVLASGSAWIAWHEDWFKDRTGVGGVWFSLRLVLHLSQQQQYKDMFPSLCGEKRRRCQYNIHVFTTSSPPFHRHLPFPSSPDYLPLPYPPRSLSDPPKPA